MRIERIGHAAFGLCIVFSVSAVSTAESSSRLSGWAAASAQFTGHLTPVNEAAAPLPTAASDLAALAQER